jgi:hypothetical protein
MTFRWTQTACRLASSWTSTSRPPCLSSQPSAPIFQTNAYQGFHIVSQPTSWNIVTSTDHFSSSLQDFVAVSSPHLPYFHSFLEQVSSCLSCSYIFQLLIADLCSFAFPLCHATAWQPHARSGFPAPTSQSAYLFSGIPSSLVHNVVDQLSLLDRTSYRLGC